ncbi:MAG: NrfD/PsrC family molybdoenzyme membrane anchor subunit [Candidatus Binataceae bacterium]
MAFEISSSPFQTPPAALTRFPEPAKPPPWKNLIAADLLLSELSSGIFIVAALGDLIAAGAYAPMARIGYFIALPLILADLFCLVADLGDPLRFHHMLRVMKPRSPMSSGMWAIGCYATFALACVILAGINFPDLRQPRAIIAGIGLAPALFVAGYKGVMFSATAQPGWKDARWLGAELATSAGLLGIAGLMLVSLFLPVKAAVPGLRLAQIVMLFVNLAFSLMFFAEFGVKKFRQWSAFRWAAYGALILFGWVAPLVLTFVGGLPLLAAAACLVIVAAILFRWDLVMIPHVFT